MTNVKAGDLAIVVSSKPQYTGRIVEVISPAPPRMFQLPNGQWQNPPKSHPAWVLKFIGGPAPCPMDNGTVAQVWYGVGADKYLRPLPGDLADVDECLPETVSDKL